MQNYQFLISKDRWVFELGHLEGMANGLTLADQSLKSVVGGQHIDKIIYI